MSTIEAIHKSLVFNRRVRVLKKHLLNTLPKVGHVLDVGCGDGLIDSLIMHDRPTLGIKGLDILIRSRTHIPVTAFNGTVIPFDDNSFDTVLFVDVLHHTEDPLVLLREAKRIACTAIVIKDHLAEGFLAGPTLRFMDWIGNAHFGVNLPYNYWSKKTWLAAFDDIGMASTTWTESLELYPPPASWIFDRQLHFITRLQHV